MTDRRFDRVAPLYARARPEYPQELYRILSAENADRPFATAIDLGCGTGLSLAGLFAIARDVIGVEPADAMRREAECSFPSARLVRAGAQETGLPAGSAELVTIATAFHWMDGPLVLAECARLLRSGGLLAIYKYDFPLVHGPAARVVEEHLRRHWDAHRSPRLKRPDDTREQIERSPAFRDVRTALVPHPLRWEPERFVEFLCSTSYVSAFMAELPDAERGRYSSELTRELADAGGPELAVSLDLTLHLARRIWGAPRTA